MMKSELLGTLESVVDEFIRDGGLDPATVKSRIEGIDSCPKSIRWNFPVAPGFLFVSSLYWYEDPDGLQLYFNAELILGEVPFQRTEEFFALMLEKNRSMAAPLKFVIAGDLFGLALRGKASWIANEYWSWLLGAMLEVGRDFFFETRKIDKSVLSMREAHGREAA